MEKLNCLHLWFLTIVLPFQLLLLQIELLVFGTGYFSRSREKKRQNLNLMDSWDAGKQWLFVGVSEAKFFSSFSRMEGAFWYKKWLENQYSFLNS